MKKFWFVLLLTIFAASSCHEDITEEVPLNDHTNDPPPDDDDDDDSPVTVKFPTEALTIAENAAAAENISLILSGDAIQDGTITITATDATDVLTFDATIAVTKGTTSAVVHIDPTDNDTVDGDKVVTLTISVVTDGFLIGDPATYQVTVIDDDHADEGGEPDGDGDGNPGGIDIKIGQDNSNAMLGNPTGATHDVADENDYLMDKGYFVESYNRSKAIPNWVSWYVGTSSLGPIDRSDAFATDTSLPAGWFRVADDTYKNSGFSRGHNCPSADRTTTEAANKATFLMTNMIPQNQQNNGGVWASFEDYIRDQVRAGNEAFVVMGNYGVGGTDINSIYKESIDGGRVAVPKRVWKVVVIIPAGTNDLSRITTATRVIAIDTPNTQDISGTWQSFRVTVDAIEASTDFNLLSQLPDAIEDVLEANVDTGGM